ncbi:hypothetical protein [Bacteroides sp. 51]|uniref:hypothetical protein n=1 Tax=Bacteroides sp. 51 TaxID=2302938 RepID=UPI0013D6AE2C|nr:hypothetical protein [Bacteroides sp. 51]NDV83846.1 hypothetical protein [Bacteroides sp. 51]
MTKEVTRLPKFDILSEDGDSIEYNYGHIYQIEETTQSDRLVVGVDENQTDLLLEFAKTLHPPYYVLYVLIVSHLDNECARYESPLFDTLESLSCFLNKYSEFFETDGRHHIWVGTIDDSGLLVYDHHNVIYAYGNQENYTRILTAKGFREEDFYFPDRHCHYFHSENDKFEEAIFNEFDWQIFPLGENDEYL